MLEHVEFPYIVVRILAPGSPVVVGIMLDLNVNVIEPKYWPDATAKKADVYEIFHLERELISALSLPSEELAPDKVESVDDYVIGDPAALISLLLVIYGENNGNVEHFHGLQNLDCPASEYKVDCLFPVQGVHEYVAAAFLQRLNLTLPKRQFCHVHQSSNVARIVEKLCHGDLQVLGRE